MGRLVYVREVSDIVFGVARPTTLIHAIQDREAEPRFTGPPAGGRGGYDGGASRGGFGGGFGGGMGGVAGGGGRQIYVSNVCYIPPFPLAAPLELYFNLTI